MEYGNGGTGHSLVCSGKYQTEVSVPALTSCVGCRIRQGLLSLVLQGRYGYVRHVLHAPPCTGRICLFEDVKGLRSHRAANRALAPHRGKARRTGPAVGLSPFPGSARAGLAMQPRGKTGVHTVVSATLGSQLEGELNPGAAAKGSALMPVKTGLAQTPGRCPKGGHAGGHHEGQVLARPRGWAGVGVWPAPRPPHSLH